MEPEYETRIGINEDDETACLLLQGRIDAFVAGELHQAAQQLLDRSLNVTVVCEHVEHMDTSAVQILLALQSGLQHKGQRLRLTSASAQVQQLLDIAGVARLLLPAQMSDQVDTVNEGDQVEEVEEVEEVAPPSGNL